MPRIWESVSRGLGRSPIKLPPKLGGDMEHMTAEEYIGSGAEAKIEVHEARICALEKAVENISSITINIERLAVSMEQMNKELEKQGQRLDKIEEQPVKRWDTVVSGIISGVIGILIGLISAGVLK